MYHFESGLINNMRNSGTQPSSASLSQIISSTLKAKKKNKKEDSGLRSLTKALTTTETSKKQNDSTKIPPKTGVPVMLQVPQKVDYTTIADQLKTVSWSNDSHQLVWLKRFTGSQPSH